MGNILERGSKQVRGFFFTKVLQLLGIVNFIIINFILIILI